MGFELDAFLGKAAEMEAWKEQLLSVVVCKLDGELGLVPVTGELIQELKDLRAWGARASRNTTIAYVSVSEFGNVSKESAVLWSNGREVPLADHIDAALEYFRKHVGIDVGGVRFELEKWRGEDAGDKWAATAILDELVARSEGPIPALIQALRHERKSQTVQNRVRQLAAERLGKLGAVAQAALPELEDTLKSGQDYSLRFAAAYSLARIGPQSVPALTRVLTSADYGDRSPIVHALGELGPAARQAVPALIEILQKPVEHDYLAVRRGAAESLGKIGPDAKAAVPALRKALRDADEFVRSAATEALAKVQGNS